MADYFQNKIFWILKRNFKSTKLFSENNQISKKLTQMINDQKYNLLKMIYNCGLQDDKIYLATLTSSYLTLPHLTSPYLTLPHLTSPYLTVTHLTLPHLTSPHLNSPHLTSPHLTSPHLCRKVISMSSTFRIKAF